MELVRDRSLDYSALRFTALIPITWMTGNYKLKKEKWQLTSNNSRATLKCLILTVRADAELKNKLMGVMV
jgi:hypothetical protein